MLLYLIMITGKVHKMTEQIKKTELPQEDCHSDDIEKVAAELPDDEMLYDLAELYKLFGDTTRIKILYILLESEMCVYHLAEMIGVSQSAVSHQLRVLKSSRLVKYRRDGKTVFYSLADDHVKTIIECGMEHITE